MGMERTLAPYYHPVCDRDGYVFEVAKQLPSEAAQLALDAGWRRDVGEWEWLCPGCVQVVACFFSRKDE